MLHSQEQIFLTDLEKEIFELLLDSLTYNKRRTILRVAGGWVRDKLLGLPSDDIDIALDDQNGAEFAYAVNDFLVAKGMETHGANPEQSKHLETARVTILGQELDFVNLRTETYTEHSRIPSISATFGTPLEDALRRDFTINSMFFNINEMCIEDITQRGLPDLRTGVIRTPLDPLVTFSDDPLRMLRAIRFASRFAFSMDRGLVEAAANPDIHAALEMKVSKERQLKELSGCFHGKLARPMLAVELLKKLGLFGSVFRVPALGELLSPTLKAEVAPRLLEPQLGLSTAEQTVAYLTGRLQMWQAYSGRVCIWTNLLIQMQVSNHEDLALSSVATCTDGTWSESSPIPTVVTVAELSRPLSDSVREALGWHLYYIPELFWAACVSGLNGVMVVEKKSKMVSLPQMILKTNLKLDNDSLAAVNTLLSESVQFSSLADCVPAVDADPSDFREASGLVLRQCKQLWRSAVLLACAMALAEDESCFADEDELRPETVFDFTHCDQEVMSGSSFLHAITLRAHDVGIIRKYRHLMSVIEQLQLDNSWKTPPLFNGHELCTHLGVPKGPMLGVLVDRQFRWQLRNPDGSGEDCLAALRETIAN